MATGPEMDAVDPELVRTEYRYEKLTWPEINEAVRQKKVVVLPVAAVEQHGHHLPIDVDVLQVVSICEEAGRRAPESMLVMPAVQYGYCHHVLDFPGTISIQPTTFVNYLLDITRSLAWHGFERIILINGHGSNHPLVEQAGRQTILQTDALCAFLSWWQLGAAYWNSDLRDSGPGGSAHACELETSMYLHLDEAGVRKDRIRGTVHEDVLEIPGADKWQWVDLTMGGGPAGIVGWTSQMAETGSIGMPELGSAEKGEKLFEHVVTELIDLVGWLQTRPVRPRRDHHLTDRSEPMPFGF
jgi:creatinine amidohydrolase